MRNEELWGAEMAMEKGDRNKAIPLEEADGVGARL